MKFLQPDKVDKVSEALEAIEEVTEAVLSCCRYSVAVADKIEIIRVVIGQHHFWSWLTVNSSDKVCVCPTKILK